jgi:hypothetical protein
MRFPPQLVMGTASFPAAPPLAAADFAKGAFYQSPSCLARKIFRIGRSYPKDAITLNFRNIPNYSFPSKSMWFKRPEGQQSEERCFIASLHSLHIPQLQ